MRHIGARSLFLGLSLVLLAAMAYPTHSSSGPVPPLMGVCDGLLGGTPALYGLCLAYCEAQGAVPADLTAPGSWLMAPSRSILDNYRSRMQPGDPDMPCLQPLCPCWTEDELAEMFVNALPYIQCATDDGSVTTSNDLTVLNSPDDTQLERCFPYGAGFPIAFAAQFGGGEDHTCAFLTDNQRPLRYFAITQSEFELCKASLQNHVAALGVTCQPLEDITYGGGIPCYP